MVKFLTRPQFRRSSPPTRPCAAGKSCVRFPCADWVARLNYSYGNKAGRIVITNHSRRSPAALWRDCSRRNIFLWHGCCTSTSADKLGYSAEESAMAPEAANLGLGCGNPLAIASLREGQVVLDLGSGAGFDCFLAARAVGSTGNVIGVDMTHEMLSKARENAQKNGFTNVEFRLGEIEALPVANNSIDVIISNCVINLSPEKQRVFDE